MGTSKQKNHFVIMAATTGIYWVQRRASVNGANSFSTMDINQVTRFEDAPELRRWFITNIPFKLEFIKV